MWLIRYVFFTEYMQKQYVLPPHTRHCEGLVILERKTGIEFEDGGEGTTAKPYVVKYN